jgi:predicted DNA-binding transcriptional regulator AlpA
METNPTSTSTPTSNSDNLLRADQVAERLNIRGALAYHLMKTGQIPTIRFIGSARVQETDLEDFIQAHKAG